MGVLSSLLLIVLYVLDALIFARCIASFMGSYNKIYQILYDLTEPIILPFRKLLDRLGVDTGMFDLAPLLAMMAVGILISIL